MLSAVASATQDRRRRGRCRRKTISRCRKATRSSSSDARLRNRNESMEARADRMVIMPPGRTAITRENPQTFPIVHSFE